MSKGGSVGSQGTTQQARGSFSGNSRPSYGGNQAGGLGSKGGSQSYQEPYRSPYGQGPSYSQNGMRSGFGGFMENPQAIPTQLPSQPITYGTATPNFDILGQVAGDNNNAEALMRMGQVTPHPHFKQERNLQDIQYGQVAPQQFSGGFGSKGGLMNQTDRGYRSGIGGFF